MSNLDQAICIATKAHSGQTDKAGKPYILHPLRLMARFSTETEMIVAVLHDVIEDSDTTCDDLKSAGFSDEVINAIGCLTKRKNENYDSFISRISGNDLARGIKIEDIKDNLDLTRLSQITEKDLRRIEKYHRALKTLTHEEEK